MGGEEGAVLTIAHAAHIPVKAGTHKTNSCRAVSHQGMRINGQTLLTVLLLTI